MRRLSSPSGVITAVAFALLAGCAQADQDKAAPAEDAAPTATASSAPAASPASPFVWPTSLRVIDDGYPDAGAPCRRIGETAATVDYLDDSADLVGCPAGDTAAIAALDGRRLAEVDGVVLVSIPRRAAQLSPARDARVGNTRFNARSTVRCQGRGLPPSGLCDAGVVRREDRSADVTILLEATEGRTLRFDAAGNIMGPGAQSVMGPDDFIIVTIGDETYGVPTALLWGG